MAEWMFPGCDSDEQLQIQFAAKRIVHVKRPKENLFSSTKFLPQHFRRESESFRVNEKFMGINRPFRAHVPLPFVAACNPPPPTKSPLSARRESAPSHRGDAVHLGLDFLRVRSWDYAHTF
jgi:hypothetical protein